MPPKDATSQANDQTSDQEFIQQLMQGDGHRLVLNARLRILGMTAACAEWGNLGDSIKVFFPAIPSEQLRYIGQLTSQALKQGVETELWPPLQHFKCSECSEPTEEHEETGQVEQFCNWQPHSLVFVLPSGTKVLLVHLTPLVGLVDSMYSVGSDAMVQSSSVPLAAMPPPVALPPRSRELTSGCSADSCSDASYANETQATQMVVQTNAQTVERSDRLPHTQLLKDIVAVSTTPTIVFSAKPATYQEVIYSNPAAQALQRNWPLDKMVLANSELNWQMHPLTWPWGERDREVVKVFLGRLEQEDYTRREYYLPDLGQWWEIELRPIHDDKNQGLIYWVVVMHHVSQRRCDEQLIQARQRATALSLQDVPLEKVLNSFLQDLEKLAEGWHANVIQISHKGCELHGSHDAVIREWVRQIPLELIHAVWRKRDPYRSGKAFINKHNNLNEQIQQEGFETDVSVSLTIEVGLYDRNKQLFGILLFTHPDIEALDHRTHMLSRLLEYSAPDISLILERDKQRQTLEYLAYTDSLTGLLNRAGFQREMRFTLEQAQNGQTQNGQTQSEHEQFALGLLDLNRFKQVNDNLGHMAGDELLSILAHRLKDIATRYPMSALARMGGDEFAFLLHNPEEIHEVSRVIAEALGTPYVVAEQPIHLSVALGWSLFPDTGNELTTLLKQADSAMYIAKRKGHTSHIFNPTQQPQISVFAIENAFHEAIQTGQFELIYQPQVRCNNRELIGAEALIRWTHPTLGKISPDLFIPVAENTGFIHELGAWVLREACQAAMTWEGELSVSVNVSAMQLRSESFQRSVWEALEQSQLPPSRLILEMTETALLSDMGDCKALLRELRRQGVRISVDDFGTGYSTLLTLRQLLADELKIDRTFTRDLNVSSGNDEGRAIVQSTVALARALGMKVVAEGVETEMQAEALREMGCDYIQGWLVAPGLRGKSFSDFVTFQLQKQPNVADMPLAISADADHPAHESAHGYMRGMPKKPQRAVSREQRAIAALLSFGIS